MYEIFRISYDGLVMTKPCQSPLLRLHPDTDAPLTAINTYCFPALRHLVDDRARVLTGGDLRGYSEMIAEAR